MVGELESFDVLALSLRPEGEDSLVRLDGELDLSTAPLLAHELARIPTRGGGRVLLDLSSLRFMDATGLRSILQASDRLERRLILRATSPQVQRILHLTSSEQRLRMDPAALSPEAVQAVHNARFVKQIWTAFREGGVQALVQLIPERAEWQPLQAGGPVLRGRDELARFWSSRPSVPAPLAELTVIGENVIVRWRRPEGSSPGDAWSLYLFNGMQLVRAVSFEHEREALAAAA